LESNRSGHSFYFSESILFKTIWILFIPILALLSRILKNQNLDSLGKTTFFIVTPIIIHLVVLPFVFLFFSVLFYNGRYDIYKILTYTLANDLYKLILIYSVFVFGYRYLSYKLTHPIPSNEKSYLKTITVKNGTRRIKVDISTILFIKTDRPYTMIYTNDQKLLHDESLKKLESHFDSQIFLRVHRSLIVNKNHIFELKSRKNGDYDGILTNGQSVRLSRHYRQNWSELLNH